ncbi:MAG: hypothetical protein D6744_04530 [Planctomycetota bacterium]|nr:MAG: hypothetical protein D6744_04530 [Planctomycetota bacterium]
MVRGERSARLQSDFFERVLPMKIHLASACAVACALAFGLTAARAQTTAPAGDDDLRRELRELRRQLTDLKQQHEQQRASDQERIAQLESEVRRLQNTSIEAQRLELFQQQIEELRRQIDSEARQAPTFEIAQSAGESTNLLNPAITVFLDMGGSVSSRGENNALNRFNLREAELDLRAAVAPFADGVLILAIEEEIEVGRTGEVDISRNFDIEEGYINFHTLPGNLALKAGKFRNAFGRNNVLHTHDLPQVTRPLAVAAFLGPEGMATTGASLSWIVPNPWDKYVEAQLEVVNADNGHESPIIGGPNAENPAVLAHVKLFDDITDTSSYELGATYLWTHTSANHEFAAHTFGVDATYLWTHPDPSKFRSVLVQSELFFTHNDVDGGPFGTRRDSAFGFYAFGQYQFDRDWYAGLRFDYTEYPNSESRGPHDWDAAISPYVSWYITEFLRLRGEYQHRMSRILGDHRSEEAVFLQMTFVIGSHPPHPYWVHR